MLGIGAAWNDEEARGLGLSFPPTAERFERLEEALQICLQMWSDDDGPYEGNLFPGPDLPHKLDVLRNHCDHEGRDYDDIEKTVLFNFDVGSKGKRTDDIVESLRGLAGLGFSVAHGSVVGVSTIEPLEIIGERIVPVVAEL